MRNVSKPLFKKKKQIIEIDSDTTNQIKYLELVKTNLEASKNRFKSRKMGEMSKKNPKTS